MYIKNEDTYRHFKFLTIRTLSLTMVNVKPYGIYGLIFIFYFSTKESHLQ
ncbi:hypothetical protein SAMN04489797_1754 [Winogradskyella sediminis]|uniref:Uncharacterized protein n=1 Tax=Winogradskyella sediminis TaxID=1382466 RepID=A0A1H1SSC8_9FLAO|nr:hypothetical protein C8N41_101413 [Winogradskyella sediminis]SDS50884.1 hypothetical protein SAMN04489797_1754 [Winogradskyella sediminis]